MSDWNRRYTLKKKVDGKVVTFKTGVTTFSGLRREAYKAVLLARSIASLERERIERLAKWVEVGGIGKVDERLSLLRKERL